VLPCLSVSINVGVSINAKGGDCWIVGCHLCQPLESDIGNLCQPLERSRYVDNIVGQLIVICMTEIYDELVGCI
jgi:hypothetical protein